MERLVNKGWGKGLLTHRKEYIWCITGVKGACVARPLTDKGMSAHVPKNTQFKNRLQRGKRWRPISSTQCGRVNGGWTRPRTPLHFSCERDVDRVMIWSRASHTSAGIQKLNRIHNICEKAKQRSDPKTQTHSPLHRPHQGAVQDIAGVALLHRYRRSPCPKTVEQPQDLQPSSGTCAQPPWDLSIH